MNPFPTMPPCHCLPLARLLRGILLRAAGLAGLLAGLLAAGAAAAAESPGPRPPGYAVPQPGRRFELPRDHGSHPEFRIEWWYVTGHLWDASSNRFGFQATFFRTAGPPRPGETVAGSASFGTDHLILAHVALLDVATGRFLHQERLHREGWEAGAEESTLRVWSAGASLELEPTGREEPVRMRLRSGIRGEASWDLGLVPSKPLVVFGTNGVSRKGADPAAASHYLTYPRIRVDGRLRLGATERPVQGQAWMDHEFSSSQLGPDQSGWDWVSVQLNDGRELMAYRLRRRDGSTDPFSTLAWVEADGSVTHQGAGAFSLEALGQWRSPRSGGEYPSGLRLRANRPSDGTPLQLDLVPLAADQELPGRIGNVPYWEGACRVLDARGREVGAAFTELTGYAGDLRGRLR